MRVSSCTTPPCMGTLKSTRTNTRLPRGSISRMVFLLNKFPSTLWMPEVRCVLVAGRSVIELIWLTDDALGDRDQLRRHGIARIPFPIPLLLSPTWTLRAGQHLVSDC